MSEQRHPGAQQAVLDSLAEVEQALALLQAAQERLERFLRLPIRDSAMRELTRARTSTSEAAEALQQEANP